MQHHTHAHIFRAKDVGRLIASWGGKPTEETKQRIRSELVAKQSEFIERQRIREEQRSRSSQQTRQRGRGR